MRTESDLQHYFIKEVKRVGGLAVKVHCEGRRGWPDLTIIMPGGSVYFVEMKAPTGRGRLSVHQNKTIARLNELGATALVISSVEEVDSFVNR